MKKVIITGATGLVGQSITRRLIRRGDEVTVLTRSIINAKKILPEAHEFVEWNINAGGWERCLEEKEAVINLAGENLMAKRWNETHKQNILNSRVLSTRALIDAMCRLNKKPQAFISASAVGYYGNSETAVNEESIKGNDFLSEVSSLWEMETSKVDQLGIRRVNVRLGAVLDNSEGALQRMITPFKLFVGGSLGSGKQWLPWIHIDDAAGIFLYAMDNSNMRGVFNAVSPEYLRMADFCRTLGKVMRRPSFFNVPEFVLKLFFGEAAGVLLNGAKVVPKRTIESGYVFKYPELETALINLIK